MKNLADYVEDIFIAIDSDDGSIPYEIKRKIKEIKENPRAFLASHKTLGMAYVHAYYHPDALDPIPYELRDACICEWIATNHAKYHTSIPIGHDDKLTDYLIANPKEISKRSNISHKVCEAILKADGANLQYFKFKVPDDLQRLAISNNVDAIRFASGSVLTEEICLAAIEKDPMLLSYIPKDMQSPNLVRIAIKKNPLSVIYAQKVPDDLTHTTASVVTHDINGQS